MNAELPNDPRAQAEARVVALLLGEASPYEEAAVQDLLRQDAQLAAFHEEMKRVLSLVQAAHGSEARGGVAVPRLSPTRRETLRRVFETPAGAETPPIAPVIELPWRRRLSGALMAWAACLVGAVGLAFWFSGPGTVKEQTMASAKANRGGTPGNADRTWRRESRLSGESAGPEAKGEAGNAVRFQLSPAPTTAAPDGEQALFDPRPNGNRPTAAPKAGQRVAGKSAATLAPAGGLDAPRQSLFDFRPASEARPTATPMPPAANQQPKPSFGLPGAGQPESGGARRGTTIVLPGQKPGEAEIAYGATAVSELARDGITEVPSVDLALAAPAMAPDPTPDSSVGQARELRRNLEVAAATPTVPTSAGAVRLEAESLREKYTEAKPVSSAAGVQEEARRATRGDLAARRGRTPQADAELGVVNGPASAAAWGEGAMRFGKNAKGIVATTGPAVPASEAEALARGAVVEDLAAVVAGDKSSRQLAEERFGRSGRPVVALSAIEAKERVSEAIAPGFAGLERNRAYGAYQDEATIALPSLAAKAKASGPAEDRSKVVEVGQGLSRASSATLSKKLDSLTPATTELAGALAAADFEAAGQGGQGGFGGGAMGGRKGGLAAGGGGMGGMGGAGGSEGRLRAGVFGTSGGAPKASLGETEKTTLLALNGVQSQEAKTEANSAAYNYFARSAPVGGTGAIDDQSTSRSWHVDLGLKGFFDSNYGQPATTKEPEIVFRENADLYSLADASRSTWGFQNGDVRQSAVAKDSFGDSISLAKKEGPLALPSESAGEIALKYNRADRLADRQAAGRDDDLSLTLNRGDEGVALGYSLIPQQQKNDAAVSEEHLELAPTDGKAQVPLLGDQPTLGRLFRPNRMAPEMMKRYGLQPAASAKPVSAPAPAAPPAAPAKPAERKAIASKAEGEPPPTAQPAPVPLTPLPEIETRANAFSTFSLNVSDVSFRLAAASLERGSLPEAGTLRSEEFVNAFDYRDPLPQGDARMAFAWERARYPFAHGRDLLRLAVRAAAVGREPNRPLNLVVLLDHSGSMERADRVAMVKEAIRVLTERMRPGDRLSVVLFARRAQLWVDGLEGSQAGTLVERLRELNPQGGTNLEEALNLAYATALRHFVTPGNNRVVLLTDGAANLGELAADKLERKVEAHRKKGVALDCFGVGWEGYNDDLLEQLSRHGDGRYGFLNDVAAVRNGFAAQLTGALQVAAMDVKAQIEFNPRRVTVYRQIGYAHHQLKREQFRDNTVDAAEIGAAEAGNALYLVQVNPAGEGPLGTMRVRYKVPSTGEYAEQSWELAYQPLTPGLDQATPTMRLAGTAAACAEWLAGSPYAAEVTAKALEGLLRGVPEAFAPDPRPGQLARMIQQARALRGE